MIPSKSCPHCLKIAVGTIAFDKWELFCPDCKVGTGMFNHWPEATPAQVAKQEERNKYFKERLDKGDYLDVPQLNPGLRARIKRQLEPANGG